MSRVLRLHFPQLHVFGVHVLEAAGQVLIVPRHAANSSAEGIAPHPCPSSHRDFKNGRVSAIATPCGLTSATNCKTCLRDPDSSAAAYMLPYSTSVVQQTACLNSCSGTPRAAKKASNPSGYSHPKPVPTSG